MHLQSVTVVAKISDKNKKKRGRSMYEDEKREEREKQG